MQDLDVIIRSRLILASSHLVKIDPIPVKDRKFMELFLIHFTRNFGPLVKEKVCFDDEGQRSQDTQSFGTEKKFPCKVNELWKATGLPETPGGPVDIIPTHRSWQFWFVSTDCMGSCLWRPCCHTAHLKRAFILRDIQKVARKQNQSQCFCDFLGNGTWEKGHQARGQGHAARE